MAAAGLTYDEDSGIAACEECGWRGVPTLLAKRGKLKGVNDHGMPVWEAKRPHMSLRCPSCRGN